MKNSTTVSGQLRITVTHAVPKPRSAGNGGDPERGDDRPEHEGPDHPPQADAKGAQESGPVEIQVLGDGLHRAPLGSGGRGTARCGTATGVGSDQTQGSGSGSVGVSVPSTWPAVSSQAVM